ncbi:MAG: CTB family bacteriocin [Aulosira sp. ZfuVER01]|nr:CTB family bacteriocin [Aulosira sp. ZfuVER01]MDZ8000815.1 CTB family bacteriocin [Aulosira sp. DedVER01a]MDZ8055914.1 CTB family bacteriocin [Aulosira sp. ZfuCHP01]
MLDENQGAIELADEELDMVAGGFNLFFAATFFEQSDRVILQNTQSGTNGSSTSSLIATRDIRTFAIQALVLDGTPSQLGQIS